MKYAFIIMTAISVMAASFFASRIMTLESLTNRNSIFDTFQQVDESWMYSDKVGAAAASDLERARIAINGPLGLSSKEAVYFIATQDKGGEILRSHCTYRIKGEPIESRWWSLTLYDSITQHYVSNIENRSSWNSVSIPRSENGRWEINVAPRPQDGAWLPSKKDRYQVFDLMLRVYNPSEKIRAILPNIPLPTIERISC